MTLTPPSRSVGTPEAWLASPRPLYRTPQAILVRALEALADELAQARAEARQHCAAAERARNAAQRLGQARQTDSLASNHARTAHYGPPPRTYSASPCAGTGAARTHERTRRRTLLLWSIRDAHMPGACVMPVLQLLGQLGPATLRVLSVHAPHYVHTARTLHAHCTHAARTLHAHCTHTLRTRRSPSACWPTYPLGLPSASTGLERPLATNTDLLHSSASWGSSCSRRRTTAAVAPPPPRRRARPHPAPYSTRRHD